MSGGNTNSTVQPALGSLRVQTSVYGAAIALVYGRTRISGNLLWYGGFTAISHTEGSGGKGGGGVATTSYTYAAAVMMALGEGPITAVRNVWKGKAKMAGDSASSGLSLAGGTLGQAVWGYLTTKYPDQALGYSGLAYVNAPSYDLGSSATIDNHSFEVSTAWEAVASGDANLALVAQDLLSNPRAGANFPAGQAGDFSAWANYCLAQNLVGSPALLQQKPAAEWLRYLLDLSNTDVVWSQGVLKYVPLGDAACSANGASYSPSTTPAYDLTEDHFLTDSADQDPLRLERRPPDDVYNHVRLEYRNRVSDYNTEIAEAKDAADIEVRGLRTKDVTEAHAICDAAVANMLATLLLQREMGVRNLYRFTLPWTFALLEPLDLVTVTDAYLGLTRVPLRINSISETDRGDFEIEAEDCPLGLASAPAYGAQAGAGFAHNYNAAPGPVVAPAFFERRNAQALVIGVAVTGQGAMWGGCQVWCSLDGATYKYVATTRGGARYGALMAGADASTGATLDVQLAGLGGTLLSGTAEEADLFITDCYVGGEFVAYQTATLIAANRYALSGLRRGGYGSTARAQTTGNTFIRIDDAIVDSMALDAAMIGQTVYFKFLGFNLWGGGTEDLASVTAYPYVVTGEGALADIDNITTTETLVVAAGAVVPKVHVAWLASSTFSHAKLAWRLNGGAWTTLPDIYGNSADLLLEDGGRLELAITPWGTVAGQVVYHSVTIAGKTAAPANVNGLAINVAGRQAVLSWNPSTDLDVLVGGWLWVRHTPVVVGATWGNASDLLPSVPGTATSSAAPLKTGTYLARWVDSSGNLSATAAALVVDASVIAQLNVVVNQDEHPAWAGAKTNMAVATGLLQLSNPAAPGSYRAPTIDLGAVHPARISAALHFSGFVVSDTIDARTALIDTWADFVGALVEDVAAELWFSATADDPAGTPAWSAWGPLRVATDYAARAYRFELRCASSSPEHNLSIDALTLSIDVEDRSESGANVASGAGACSVSFARPFFAAPAIGITAQGMQTGDYYELAGKTLAGFTVTFRNAGGTAVSRTFDWIAKGY